MKVLTLGTALLLLIAGVLGMSLRARIFDNNAFFWFAHIASGDARGCEATPLDLTSHLRRRL